MTPYSVYLHIPFCNSRCNYCDFNTYAGQNNLIPAYVQALINEIEYWSFVVEDQLPIHSIYIGGGTPSLLSAAELEAIMGALKSNFHFLPDLEISIEANPGSLWKEDIKSIRRMGGNRLSLGMQSAISEELSLLGRQHNHQDVIAAITRARGAGFENLSLDLIFGLPFQTEDTWRYTLTRALDLEPEHFSIYGLSVEPGTSLQSSINRGLIPDPDPDFAAEMYEIASEILEQAGYEQYEISNWALEDSLQCRHNLQYWRNMPYLGFGAGAHGFANGVRTANVLSPSAYIQRMGPQGLTDTQERLQAPRTPATDSSDRIDPQTEMRETMMMGLRLTQEGVSEQSFQNRFRKTLTTVFGVEIQELISYGLLDWNENGDRIIRLTPKGRLLANQVFIRFV
jgi:oxygen-independent coproporphyrinogen-3 oxidase